MTIQQCTSLEAREAFAFKSAAGRTVRVNAGARFWVTNSMANQATSGCVMLDREGRGHISHGHAFAPTDIARLFNVRN